MFQWTIRKRLADAGVKNAHELATGAGLSYPVASRIWLNTPVARIDAATVRKLAAYLRVKRPMSIVELVDDE